MQNYPIKPESHPVISDFSEEKQLVRQYYAQLDTVGEREIPATLQAFTSAEYLWRGFHPFNEIRSAREVAESFWQPLRGALTSL